MKTFQTRAKYLREIASFNDTTQLAIYVNKFTTMDHPSNRFLRAVTRRLAHIERKQMNFQHSPQTIALSNQIDEFEKLVERFTREGKPNPEKSARASLARKAQLAKKVAPSFDGGF